MKRPVVILKEYESVSVELSREEAVGLAAAAGSALTVAVASEPGHWAVTAAGRVGSVVLGELSVLIRPKVPLHNLVLLLDVGVPEDAWSDDSFNFAADSDLLTAMGAFFARTALAVLRRGHRQGYRAESDRLVTLRGRIDMTAQLRQPGVASPIACQFDEFSSDIPENTAIRATARRLLHLRRILPNTRRDLEQILSLLEDVPDRDISAEAIDAIPITRLNRHYRPALRLASVILGNTTLIDRPGVIQGSAFLLNMPLLFQSWVTDRLRRCLADEIDLVAEPSVALDVDGRVKMEPDLVFRHSNGTDLYAGDVKYKLSNALGQSADYYQLHAYTTALKLCEGVLIYCQTDTSPPDREIVVRASEKRLWTYRLSMQGSNVDVESAVFEMAAWITDRIGSCSLALVGAPNCSVAG